MCSAFRLISQLPGNDFPTVNNWKEGLTDFQLWFRTAVIQYLYNCVFKSGARDDLFSFLVFAYIFKCYSFDCDDSSKGFDFEGIPLRELPTHVFDDHLLIESVCNRIYFCFLFLPRNCCCRQAQRAVVRHQRDLLSLFRFFLRRQWDLCFRNVLLSMSVRSLFFGGRLLRWCQRHTDYSSVLLFMYFGEVSKVVIKFWEALLLLCI